MQPCGTKGLKTFAGIGSRETPEPILRIMTRAGTVLCNLGYRLRSGGAGGADLAFQLGVRLSPRFYEIGMEIYIPWNNFSDFYEDPSEGIWNADKFYDTKERSKEIAIQARGSAERLSPGGLSLHARNSYQALGRFLDDPVKMVICYAKPLSNNRVKGGTNTAVQIARSHNVPIINLATDDGYSRMTAFLKKHEE